MTPAELRRRKGLVLDTNLFLIYVVGLFSPQLISEFKRTQAYSERDFRVPVKFFARFQRITTTPHILTQVTDLLETFNRSWQNRVFPRVRQVIARFEEQYIPSLEIATRHLLRFDKFGLADAVIAKLAAQNHLVLTDDLQLFGYLESLNLPVVNFNHLRSGYLMN